MSSVILLFGMPRSGTTWVGKIFDSHPETLYCHEPDTALPMSGWLEQFPAISSAESYCSRVNQYLNTVRGMRSIRVAGKLPLFPKTYRSALRSRLLQASVYGAKFASRLLGDAPVLGYKLSAHSGAQLVWKSIESLGRLGVIASCLPEARAVHLVRHPCGYIASVIRGETQGRFVSDTSASEDLGVYQLLARTTIAGEYGLTIDGLMAMKPHERLAWRWVVYNEKAARDCGGSERYLQVSYDDVCRSPAELARAMFEFSGLSWHPQTISFIEASTGRHQAQYYSVYKDPAVAADRWRKDLHSEIVADVLAITQKSAIGRQFQA